MQTFNYTEPIKTCQHFKNNTYLVKCATSFGKQIHMFAYSANTPPIQYYIIIRNIYLQRLLWKYNQQFNIRFQLYNWKVFKFCLFFQPPPLWLMMQFCEEASAYLKQNRQNIILVHCKGKHIKDLKLYRYLDSNYTYSEYVKNILILQYPQCSLL